MPLSVAQFLVLHFVSPKLLLLPVHRFFFFNDTATTEIYTLSLHDALPIYQLVLAAWLVHREPAAHAHEKSVGWSERSEEHTSELQSRQYLVCRLLLEKKKPTREYRQELLQHLLPLTGRRRSRRPQHRRLTG